MPTGKRELFMWQNLIKAQNLWDQGTSRGCRRIGVKNIVVLSAQSYLISSDIPEIPSPIPHSLPTKLSQPWQKTISLSGRYETILWELEYILEVS